MSVLSDILSLALVHNRSQYMYTDQVNEWQNLQKLMMALVEREKNDCTFRIESLWELRLSEGLNKSCFLPTVPQKVISPLYDEVKWGQW